MLFQRTIQKEASFTGIGLHTGLPFKVILSPLEANSGIKFMVENEIIDNVYTNAKHTQLATQLTNNRGKSILTPEHLLSAIYALGIDNILINIIPINKNNGGVYEIPIMDGSASPFVMLLLNECKIKELSAPKKFLKVKKEIIYKKEDKFIKISPSNGLEIDYTIDFKHPVIGKENLKFKYSLMKYIEDISKARTFGFLKEIQYLKSKGLIQGGSLENAIVLDDKKIINEYLRYPDEFVRHKVLDLIGDLSLSEYFILGKITGYKTSHSINNLLLHKIFASKENYEIIEFTKQIEKEINMQYATSII